MRLKDKVAIVTGGGSGIARETCKLFAREGAKLMIADIVIEGAKALAKELQTKGFQASAIKLDITNLDEAYQVAKATIERFGQIDILANIAGGSMGPTIKSKPSLFAQSDMDYWEEMINLNLYGAMKCTRAVINHMIERRTGKIISFASTAGIIGQKTRVPYSAAKAGIIGFTKALAKEVAPYGINVNCISPSIIASPRVLDLPKKETQEWIDAVPLGRFGKPEEIAFAVLFLASDEASFITGDNLIVGGGFHIYGGKGY